MRLFGLTGFPLTHSWSEKYFTEKFRQLELKDHSYKLFPLADLNSLPQLIREQRELQGLNVTIPFKEAILPFLDALDASAEEIKAVNVIKILRDPKEYSGSKINGVKLIGYNTDAPAFRESIRPMLRSNHQKALILGTGGSAKAVAWVLRQLHVEYLFVSRQQGKGDVTYSELNEAAVKNFPFLINCTPSGMYPDETGCPEIPYECLDEKNFLYDLVYNPEMTLFLQKGKAKGALVKNGLEMLNLQAEKSWELWNS